MIRKTEDKRQRTDPASLSASPWHNTHDARRIGGSAIILAVVLTSLLAIIGVIFLLSSRVDSIATSAISDNENLNLAVDTVIAKISDELTEDIDPYEYYDYPDDSNPWLASLEPNEFKLWRHITDLYDQLGGFAYDLVPNIIYERDERYPAGNSSSTNGYAADADGDGIIDSLWVQLPGINSSKGKLIYAAIRIIDNGGMLNVNTGFKFDPNTSDGSSQAQINLMALEVTSSDEEKLKNTRANYPYSSPDIDPNNLDKYAKDVVWQYGRPDGNYAPFDISDELEMRYRFLINHEDSNCRVESWSDKFTASVITEPYDGGNGNNVNKWFNAIYEGPDYAYRHIATINNIDRIIDPNGDKMMNINKDPLIDPNKTCEKISGVFITGGVPFNVANVRAAQITANLIDYVDGDSNVTVVNANIDVAGVITQVSQFGFETPCIYISELTQNFIKDANDTSKVHKSYAIELYKPYGEDDFPTNPEYAWQLSVDDRTIPIENGLDGNNWAGSRRFYVIEDVNFNAPINIDFNEVINPGDINQPIDPCQARHSTDISFQENSSIELQRRIPALGNFITVDRIQVPGPDPATGWLMDLNSTDPEAANAHSCQRDIWPHKEIRRIWGITPNPSVGNHINSDVFGDSLQIQAHPANKLFTNVGELGRIFYAPAYHYGGEGPDFNVAVMNESEIRIDLAADANFQQLFEYFTMIDPFDHNQPADETRIKGRININTAPWFVIAQLPWVTDGTPSYELAQAIIAYRDKLRLIDKVVDYSGGRGLGMVDPCGTVSAIVREERGFVSVGELMNVTHDLAERRKLSTPPTPYPYDLRYDIRKYATDGVDLGGLPDLTTPDDSLGGAVDDFEERDVIFARISNLITVRSDIFTAYILIRIGAEGPQKRVVVILDRSEAPAKPVKVIAIQQVPDPR